MLKAHTEIHAHTHMHARTHTHTYTHTQTHSHTHTCGDTHTQTYTDIATHMHTHLSHICNCWVTKSQIITTKDDEGTALTEKALIGPHLSLPP